MDISVVVKAIPTLAAGFDSVNSIDETMIIRQPLSDMPEDQKTGKLRIVADFRRLLHLFQVNIHLCAYFR